MPLPPATNRLRRRIRDSGGDVRRDEIRAGGRIMLIFLILLFQFRTSWTPGLPIDYGGEFQPEERSAR